MYVPIAIIHLVLFLVKYYNLAVRLFIPCFQLFIYTHLHSHIHGCRPAVANYTAVPTPNITRIQEVFPLAALFFLSHSHSRPMCPPICLSLCDNCVASTLSTPYSYSHVMRSSLNYIGFTLLTYLRQSAKSASDFGQKPYF